MTKRLWHLGIWIVAFQCIGYLIGLLTQQNIQVWYQTIHQSALTPPNIVFPIVWGILYVVLAYVGWSLFENRKQGIVTFAFAVFMMQMLLNWLWTPLFFQWHFLAASFYLILAMIILTLAVIWLIRRHLKYTSLLLIPYCVWLVFALYLNGFIWLHN
ncbi:MAG: tryptophan-rich sensory protein [Gammaproteobacteria bacterium]|nr:tryptophan-rich sensory protein [Gammaproteobacteria bacterium]